MSRRPFDASFSRRPGHGAGPGGGLAPSVASASASSSLMGDYHRGGGGGHGGHLDDDLYPSQPQRVSRVSLTGSGGGGGGAYRGGREQDDSYDAQPFDRVPRDGGVRGQGQPAPSSRGREDFDYRGDSGRPATGQSHGGWRQRSPSPRFVSREMDRVDRGGGGGMDLDRDRGGGSTWTTRGGGGGAGGGSRDYQDETDFIGSSSRSSSSNIYDSGAGASNFRQGHQQQDFFQSQPQRMYGAGGGGGGGILRNADPLVKVLLQPAQVGGLMGNMGLNFGMLGASPMVVPAFSNPSPFAQPQQILQQQALNPFASGIGGSGGSIGSGGGGSSIYGSQTQQALDRSRNLITASDNNARRNDFYRGGGRGRRSEPERNRSDSASRNDSPRKRNLVLRDPRPEEGIKRPRTSAGGGGGGGNNKKPTQVKRNDLLGDGRKSLGSSHRPATSGKDKEYKKDKSATTSAKAEGADADKALSAEEKEKLKKEKEAADKDRKTEYDAIPGSLLVCKVCQKSMNDGQSFESHLSGRAHQSLMKILEERFAKRVELLMNESKCSEDEIGIEMDRQRRAGAGKGGRAEKKPSNYCKMCDCHYAMNWGAHKVSLGHRVLKEFLHPTCQFCKTHFMHRKDWAIHLQTPAHLKKLAELKESQGSSPILEEQESPYQDELFTIYFDRNRDERCTNAITIKSKDGRESLTEEMKEILKNDRGEIVLPDGEIPLPKEYSSELMVGADAVVGVSGNRCRVCRVYIPEDKSVDSHCSSREHFNQYVSFLKRVNAHREHKERDRKEAEEKAKREAERAKRREEEKAKADAIKKEKAAAKDKEAGESSSTDKVQPASTTGTNGDTEVNMDVDGDVKVIAEVAAASAEPKPIVEVVDVEDDEEEEQEEEGEGEEEEMEEGNEIEDDILEDEHDEEDEDEDEEVEGEDAFIPSSSQEVGHEEEEEQVGNEDALLAPSDSEIADETPKPVGLAAVIAKLNEEAVTVTNTDTVVELEEQDKNGNGEQELEDHEEESNDSVEHVEIAPTVVKTPGTARRGRGGRGGATATPAAKGLRGPTTPALRNVQAKVDTNMRGGGVGRGRGGPRGRSPRARGRGTR